jgi:hypothetical protein
MDSNPGEILMDWLVISLFVAPPAIWLLYNGLFWCFCWCFCKLDAYFQDRFMDRLLKNMENLEKIAEREAA